MTRTFNTNTFAYFYGFSGDTANVSNQYVASGDVCNMKTDVGGPQTIEPPVLNSAQSQDGMVYLEWDPVSGADSYKVFYTPAGGSQMVIPDILTENYTVPNLQNGVSHTFSVAAVSNTLGESDPSEPLTQTPIGTPTLLSAVAGD
ncbi:MAG: fibronectin type III domain-containing protein, partial [Leptospiraceae bacterium]|nr:fibronectin type III domain-containing protein [Leptospiraceae bacterium]